MKNLLINTIYSEGKYPIQLLLSKEFLEETTPVNALGGNIGSSDLNISINLPELPLNIYMFTIPSLQPIKVGNKDLNDVYIESKDHSKYVKFTWYEKVTKAEDIMYCYIRQESIEDLSWIHYISYRDEEGIFIGNILEFSPLLSFVGIGNFWDSPLVFIRPKNDFVNFIWGDIDSSNSDSQYLTTSITWLNPFI